MPEFHAILTTDYVDYDTTTNRLDLEGAAVERGDVALGLAVADPADPPRWAVVRNMSDRHQRGPAHQLVSPEPGETTWAVGYYTAYGPQPSARWPPGASPSPSCGPCRANGPS